MTEDKATAIARRCFNRIAPFYIAIIDGLIERSRSSEWRELLWSKVEGKHILEIAVGIGKNFPYYPADAEITAIDFSEKMLKYARNKASNQELRIHLHQMDVQNLEFRDNAFDTVVASFAFCSVPDPLRGLTEIKRVCKPGGKVVLLEHVQSTNRTLARLMNIITPLTKRLIGDNPNRRTVENIKKSGLTLEQVTDLYAGIFKLIEARAL